ncbi:MAG: glycosyltransferase involved in cell wall biosynthesis [Sediminicola sp.]|jgi:glycosyltransferase involved in cell wall biosynthesis
MNVITNDKGLVSVVIPGYKNEFIIEAIDSVLSQTYNKTEIIVVDDGSPNKLKSALKEYIEAGKVRYIHQDNQKMAAARNNGIEHAKGDFIAFLDDDDLWEPQKLESQIDLFDNPAIGLVYTFAEGFKDGKHVPIPNFEISHQGKIFGEIFLADFIPNSSVIVRRSCFDKVGLFKATPDFFGVDDCDMWTRITYYYDASCVAQKLTKIRLHEGQFSSDKSIMYENDLNARRNLINDLVIPKVYQKQYFARAYFEIAFDLRKTAKFKALMFYMKSIQSSFSKSTFFAILKLLVN